VLSHVGVIIWERRVREEGSQEVTTSPHCGCCYRPGNARVTKTDCALDFPPCESQSSAPALEGEKDFAISKRSNQK